MFIQDYNHIINNNITIFIAPIGHHLVMSFFFQLAILHCIVLYFCFILTCIILFSLHMILNKLVQVKIKVMTADTTHQSN